MNEIALHRGASPHLNTIDIFVDGQHLTEAVVGDIFMDSLESLLRFLFSPMVSLFQLPPVRQRILYLLAALLFIPR